MEYIWPEIEKRDPNIELHIYYKNNNNNNNNIKYKMSGQIKMKGELQKSKELSRYRVLLSPMRYGGGIKEQINESWFYGLPVVTTPIGAEGMFNTTFNHNKQYQNIDINSRFYQNDTHDQ